MTPRRVSSRSRLLASSWQAAPAFERAAYAELAESLLRELTRLGVTKPMRYDPGANAAE